MRSKDAAALITFPPHLSSPAVVSGWISQIGFSSDACVTLQGFSSDPSLSASFPQYSGLLTIHSTPSPTTLLPPSYKFSELRGLHAGGGTGTAPGGGENNLAFKCLRKRFVIETLHLDIEGGVSERRTAPPTGIPSVNTMVPSTSNISHTHVHSTATVEIVTKTQSSVTVSDDASPPVPKKKPKKSVAFRSDQPELYDF
jgi:elongator complex protein 4